MKDNRPHKGHKAYNKCSSRNRVQSAQFTECNKRGGEVCSEKMQRVWLIYGE